MIIKMTRGFSLKPIAKRILATNEDIVLILPEISVTKAHPKIIIENDETDPKPDLIIAMRGEKRYNDGKTPVFHFASNNVHTVLNDKYLFAEQIKGDPHYLLTIPVANAQEIESAVQEVTKQSKMACIKPRRGVFGHGYWALGSGDAIAMLNDPKRRFIALGHYLFGAQQSNIDHVVMPRLPGPEVTFDVLAHQGEMLSWCSRTKNNEDENQIMSSSHDLKDHVKLLISKFQLNGIVGIQYRQDEKGEWKILEINDRPCGGVVKSEDAGAKLIEQWAGLMSGRLKPEQVIHHHVKGIMKTKTSTVFYS